LLKVEKLIPHNYKKRGMEKIKEKKSEHLLEK